MCFLNQFYFLLPCLLLRTKETRARPLYVKTYLALKPVLILPVRGVIYSLGLEQYGSLPWTSPISLLHKYVKQCHLTQWKYLNLILKSRRWNRASCFILCLLLRPNHWLSVYCSTLQLYKSLLATTNSEVWRRGKGLEIRIRCHGGLTQREQNPQTHIISYRTSTYMPGLVTPLSLGSS